VALDIQSWKRLDSPEKQQSNSRRQHNQSLMAAIPPDIEGIFES
jgi:hypothetical protein